MNEQVDIASIRTAPGLSPKRDEHLLRLLEEAVAGSLPMYYAAVPLALCIPFDPDYRPDLHPVGTKAIDQVISAWEEGHAPKLVVYPRGAWFVVSDDYIPLFAALAGLPDYVPCWILGKPDNDHLRDVQGPLAVADVPSALNIAPSR